MDFDSTNQLRRAAEQRDLPFAKRRAKREKAAPAIAIVNPNGVQGEATIADGVASCRFGGAAAVKLAARYVDELEVVAEAA